MTKEQIKTTERLGYKKSNQYIEKYRTAALKWALDDRNKYKRNTKMWYFYNGAVVGIIKRRCL